MPEISELVRRLATTWLGDVVLAAATVAWTLAAIGAGQVTAEHRWAALLAFAVPFAAAVALRRFQPLAAIALACAVLLAAWPLGLTAALNGPLVGPLIWTPFLLAYSLGAGSGLGAGLGGIAALIVSMQIENRVFSPIIVMITVGPWLAGRVMQSRRRLSEQLRIRNAELLAEQERFAQESVRYERARIARELHDIVAHCLSVMVVQASAGQRVATADRDLMAEALTSVAEAAAQAQEEIGRLVELLGGQLPAGARPGLPMIEELVRRAATTGLDVSCRLSGACGELSPAASEAAFRVVQEGLTNALKHAPGAPVTVTVGPAGDDVVIRVVNSAPRNPPSGLEHSGAHYGLAAMRDRVIACGGSVSAGQAAGGGWQVVALLPGSSEEGDAVPGESTVPADPAAEPQA